MKELILEVINTLPEDVTLEDFLEALYLKVKLNNALDDVKNNRTLTTEELKKELFNESCLD